MPPNSFLQTVSTKLTLWDQHYHFNVTTSNSGVKIKLHMDFPGKHKYKNSQILMTIIQAIFKVIIYKGQFGLVLVWSKFCK